MGQIEEFKRSSRCDGGDGAGQEGRRGMILYSIIPPEQVFRQEHAPAEIRETDGGFVEGTAGNSGFIVSRLCATDPKMYLDERYSPGVIPLQSGGTPGSLK